MCVSLVSPYCSILCFDMCFVGFIGGLIHYLGFKCLFASGLLGLFVAVVNYTRLNLIVYMMLLLWVYEDGLLGVIWIWISLFRV